MKQLAVHLQMSGLFAVTMVGKLMQRGLVVKTPDSTDRRRVCLEVTPQARDLLRELVPLQRKVNDVQFGCLTRSEFQSLVGLLGKLVEGGDRALALQHYLAQHDVST